MDQFFHNGYRSTEFLKNFTVFYTDQPNLLHPQWKTIFLLLPLVGPLTSDANSMNKPGMLTELHNMTKKESYMGNYKDDSIAYQDTVGGHSSVT